MKERKKENMLVRIWYRRKFEFPEGLLGRSQGINAQMDVPNGILVVVVVVHKINTRGYG